MKTRIMSFNIWGDYFKNPVELRQDDIASVIEKYSPDILAMQEATANFNSSKLFAELKDKYTFAEPADAPENNFVPLIFKTDRFKAIDLGYVDYADTPDPSKGITWAVLEDKDGSKIAVMCTHFWWQKFGDPEHDAIRVSNARVLTETADRLIAKYSSPVVALGDFNSTLGVPSLEFIGASGWSFAQQTAADSDSRTSHHGNPTRGEDGRYHGEISELDFTHSIDHIIYKGTLTPTKFSVVVDREALDASDHSPIFADFE